MKHILLAVTSIIGLFFSSMVYSADTANPPEGKSRGVIADSYIVTFKNDSNPDSRLIDPPNRSRNLHSYWVPFAEHSTGQSKTELGRKLGLNGQVVRIFETINSIQVRMNSKEAHRLSLDKRVARVEPEQIVTSMVVQNNPGWALDRLDEPTPLLDGTYIDNGFTGAGQTIYILDTGMNVGSPAVTAEFGNRATMFFDTNGGTGSDCVGHGTQVASAAAGNRYGVARGALLNIVKITIDCTHDSSSGMEVAAFNWLAANAPAGTIVNYSRGYWAPYTIVNGETQYSCGWQRDAVLEESIVAAHDAGIIVVVAAGNDGCDTANYSPAAIPQAFVVGATNRSLVSDSNPRDIRAKYSGNGGSRIGWNISAFAPGRDIALMNYTGVQIITNGTSFAAPYVAGIFAIACQAVQPFCSTPGSAAAKYDAMRNTGLMNTVTNYDGTPLTGATSRFLVQRW